METDQYIPIRSLAACKLLSDFDQSVPSQPAKMPILGKIHSQTPQNKSVGLKNIIVRDSNQAYEGEVNQEYGLGPSNTVSEHMDRFRSPRLYTALIDKPQIGYNSLQGFSARNDIVRTAPADQQRSLDGREVPMDGLMHKHILDREKLKD